MDRNIVITDTGSLQELLAYSYTEPRFDLMTSGAFAGIGLLPVVVGVWQANCYFACHRACNIVAFRPRVSAD